VHEVDQRPKGERDAYKLLYAGFVAAPIIAGFDKFTDRLGNWDRYLSDDVAKKLPVERHTFMQGVGLVEIAAGMLVAAKPRWGGYVGRRGSVTRRPVACPCCPLPASRRIK
jgi:hypothetical protein